MSMRTSRQTDVNSCSRATPNRMRFVFAARQTKVRSPQAPPKMTAVAANPATLPRADLSRWPVSINQSVIISAPLKSAKFGWMETKGGQLRAVLSGGGDAAGSTSVRRAERAARNRRVFPVSFRWDVGTHAPRSLVSALIQSAS